jgi:hypothetical protein
VPAGRGKMKGCSMHHDVGQASSTFLHSEVLSRARRLLEAPGQVPGVSSSKLSRPLNASVVMRVSSRRCV